MTKSIHRRIATLAAATALAVLSACSGGAPEPDVPVENEVIVNEVMVENVVVATPTPTPSPTTTPAVTADVPPVSDDEQMLDDADATGMTARTDRGEPTPAPAPVE